MGPPTLLAVKLLFALQTAQATVVGTVRDEKSGEALAGAVVSLPDLHQATVTAADGRYVLRQVPPGLHAIAVHLTGYAPRTLRAEVPADMQVEISVALRPVLYVMPPVTVRPPVAVRGVEDGDSPVYPDRVSSMAAARNNPLLAEPDAFQALAGGDVVLKAESPGGVNVRGGASDQTAYLLDGIPVLSPYHTAGIFSALNPDALYQLQLSSTTPSPADPDALSGTISARTRTPGVGLATQGSIGTTQARLTVDGALATGGAGFLVSLRSGRPGVLAARDRTSYLQPETDDGLLKVEAPALGGRVRLLGYVNENGITAAASARAVGATENSRRNAFAWHSQSLGAEWTRRLPTLTLSVLAWRAAFASHAHWSARAGWLGMQSNRRDEGILVTAEHASAGASTLAGIRFNRSVTSYGIQPDSAGTAPWNLGARTPVLSLFARRAMPIGHRWDLLVGAAVAATRRGAYLAPEARLQWRFSERVTISGSYARRHQLGQSLRNTESVAGNIFPADLYVGVGARGIPVARSDQVVLAADYRPAAGARLGVQAYQRAFEGLVLVAPRAGEPFATSDFAVGAGTSSGVSLEAALSTGHWGLLGSYGWQRTRLRYDQSSYVPDHGATQLFEGGVIAFPSPSFSIRLGATAAVGRRTTPLSGGFEWEACNLLDAGCEFAGSPHQSDTIPGAAQLPLYLRVDLGLRKTWHLAAWGREATVALFGTVTNLLNRRNALTWARDPETGSLSAVTMRPLAPLVVGLDWRF